MLRAVALSLAVILLAITVGRASQSWPRDAHLGYAEGIWLGLAVDASNGVLYRPLDGPQGVGGSRYFPLFYLAIATGITFGLAPITAGYLVAAGSIALLLAAVFVFLRRLGADPVVAFLAVGAALACQPLQMAALGIRGDALAAGLALMALGDGPVFHNSSTGGARSGWRLWLAPMLFALAFATKPTSLYAPLAAFVALGLGGQGAESRRLAMRTIACMAVLLAIFVLASGGRMLPVLIASGSGGTRMSTVLAAPWSALRILRRVPESAYFILFASAIVIGRWVAERRRLSIERTAFVCCGLSTLAIFASPATIENHLIDLTALAVVVIGAFAATEPRWRNRVVVALLAGGLLAGGSAFWRSRTKDAIDRRAARTEVLAALAGTREPILFDQPMLDAQRGTSPYVIDQYVYSVRIGRDQSAIDPLIQQVEGKQFGAIVFDVIAVDLTIAEVYPGEAGVRFKAALDRAYQLDRIVAGKPIYRPRQ